MINTHFITQNAIKYTIKNLLKVACNGMEFDITVSDDMLSAIVNICGKKVIFLMSQNEDIQMLLSGSFPMQSIQSADGVVEVPIMLKESLPFGQVSDNTLMINADIVTVSFIMLSRYEETLTHIPDANRNFTAEYSIAMKYNFIDIPIVDEYAMLLREYFKKFLPGIVILPRKTRITPTHDIDDIRRFDGFYKSMKTIFGGDLLLGKSLSVATKSMEQYIKSFDNPDKDPLVISVDKFVNLSKELGLKSEFYFMGANKSKYNVGYDVSAPTVRRLMDRITKNNMVVGFHAGYDTSRDKDLFIEEKYRVEEALGAKILGGRQHYLRFDINRTYRIWEQSGMKYDSTVGYNEREGFRCGTCHEFNPWDFENDCSMELIERPLIVMDVTLWNYRMMSIEEGFNTLMKLYSRCKAVEGNFIILWHNAYVFRSYSPWFQNVYERFLRYVT